CSLAPSCPVALTARVCTVTEIEILKYWKPLGRFRSRPAHGRYPTREWLRSGAWARADFACPVPSTLEHLMAGALALPLGHVHLDELSSAVVSDGLVVVSLIESGIHPAVFCHSFHIA